MTNVYIYGAGGHGKVALFTVLGADIRVAGFADDNILGTYCGLPVLPPSELSNIRPLCIHFAIGNNLARQRLQREWQARGVMVKTVVHPSAVIYPSARVGPGSLIAAGAVVGPDALIGDGCIVNHNAVVDHDCVVGAFCHVAPGATLGGGVNLGDGCLVGAGANILQCLTIGRNATIGAGAVVLKDVADGVTVIGNPALPVSKAQAC
jgi:sugar O-acyltransferase (sialic acid O-acetyltransferase NeuD family)